MAHFVGRNRLLDCGQSDRETETDRDRQTSIQFADLVWESDGNNNDCDFNKKDDHQRS